MAEPTNLIASALRGNPGSDPVGLPSAPPVLTATPVAIPTPAPVSIPTPTETPKIALSLEKEPLPAPFMPGVVPSPLPPAAPAAPVVASVPTSVPIAPQTPSIAPPDVPVADGSKRTFLLMLVLVVLAAVLLAGGAFWLWQRMTVPAPVASQSVQPVLKVATPEEVAGLVVVPSAAAYYGVMAASYPNARVYELSTAVANGTLSYDEDSTAGEVVFFLKIQGGNRSDRSLVMWLADEAGGTTLADKVAYETMGATEYGYVSFRVPKGEVPYTGVILSYEVVDWEVPPDVPTEKVMDVQL